MSKIAVFLADGFEEIEGLTLVDICRRCGITVETVSVMAGRQVVGSHNIPVLADAMLEDADFASYDCLVLPGGMPGTKNLEACNVLMEQVDSFAQAPEEAGKYVAAICAAPSILGHRGILQGRNATCFPGFEDQLTGADVKGTPVEKAGHIITGRGMGVSLQFALAVAAVFAGQEKADAVAEGITAL